MVVEETGIDGVLLIKPKIFGDNRGYFVETWQKNRYEAFGIHYDFVQDNHSMSTKGILRGLHFQTSRPQGKLVSVSYGSVFDVAVDVRANSKTFGKTFSVELTHENQWQIWIAPGLAHGFCVLSDVAHFHYKCTDYYDPSGDAGVIWNDPDLNITWPIASPVLSQKDTLLPALKELK